MNCVFISILVLVKIINLANSKDPLYLSPYIACGEIEKARELSKIQLKDFNDTESYSGYLTVNRKECNSNLFFLFFPSENNYIEDPIIQWLAGGPGGSSVREGPFIEHGPFEMRNGFVARKQYSWTKYHSMLFIDNPVGVGFSFTKKKECYATSEIDVGNDLYEALVQFYKLFPELKTNEFYVSGESYGGKFGPAIAYKILNANPKAPDDEKINLKGLMLGNAWIDPENQIIKIADHLYELGAITKWQQEDFNKGEQQAVDLIRAKKFLEANNVQNTLLPVVGAFVGRFTNYTNLMYTSILHSKDYQHPISNQESFEYLQKEYVMEAFHVGDRRFIRNPEIAQKHLYGDHMQSLAPWMPELLANYRILFYTGQLDLACSYITVENFIKHLNYDGAQNWSEVQRNFWYVDKEFAGHIKTVGNLTHALVRNAGHAVIIEQPKWALELIYKFIRKIL